jgi:hypothetical protein
MALPIVSGFSSTWAMSAEGAETIKADRQRLMSKYKSGNFDEQVLRFLGDIEEASQRTKDLIWALHDTMGMTKAQTKGGVTGIHVGDVAKDRDKALSAFTKAADSLFRDYGIDTSQRIDFTIDGEGMVRVMGSHSDSDKIEELVNSSFLMRSTIARVLNDTRLVETANNGPEFADANLVLSLMGGDGDLQGVVRMFNDLLASSTKKKKGDTEEGTLKDLLDAFDKQQVDRQKAIEADRERAKQVDTQALLARQAYQNAYVQQLMAQREDAARQGDVPPATTTPPTFI